MGNRGPKPTPTKVLKMRGSWRGKLRRGEPKPVQGHPVCPDWLDCEGRACWERTTAALDGMGLLTAADTDKLAGMCQQWSTFVRTSKQLNALEEADSLMEARRLASINGDAWRHFSQAADGFGLCPSARARIPTGEQRDTRDAKAKFLQSG